MLGALITSCNNGSETARSTLSEIVPAPAPSRIPTVVISRVATIPVNDGNTATHAIRVDNHTNHDLRLLSAQIDNNTIEDSAAACNILGRDAACSIPVLPKNAQEATVIKLSYKDEAGKVYDTAQLINYSETVMNRDGFIVSEGEFAEVYSTNDYSLTIPFIADDDYDELDISSDVMMLEKHLDCSGKVIKGTHCTATLTLPAATGAGYGNQITLKGKTANGRVNQHRFNTRAYFEDRPSLVLSGGPLALMANNTAGAANSTTLRVVNNGVLPVNIFSEDYKALSSEIHGTITENNVTSALAKTIGTCGFDGKTSTSVGTVAKRGDVCEIRLGLNNLQQPQSGHDQYSINYNGEAGPSTTKTTFIYYTGLTSDIDPNRPDGLVNYAYKISGSLNFVGTALTTPATSRTEYIQIQNTGKNPIRITDWNVAYPAAMRTRDNECANKVLATTEACRIYVSYTPTGAVATSSVLGEIKAVRADNNATTDFIAPNKQVGILYSATGNPPATGTLTLSHGRVYLEKEAGVAGSVSEDIIIENSGRADYLLGGISALTNPNLSRSLTMSLPATFTLPGSTSAINNPLSALTVVNNFNAEGPVVRLAPGQRAVIRYSYNSTTAEIGTLHQQILRANTNDTVPIQVDYATTTSPIKVTEPVAVGTRNIAGNSMVSGDSFALTWANKLTLKAEYAPTGASVKNFIVDDGDLPYGFAVKAAQTTCPTISKSNSPTTLTSKCEVHYEFLRSDISNVNSYTLVTQNAATQSFKTPAYSLEGATDKLRRKVTPSQSFSYQTRPFVAMTTLQTSSGNTRTVTFQISSYDAGSLSGMRQYPIIVTPDYAANSNISGATSCVINSPASGQTCSIIFTLTNTGGNKTLPITYASTEDAYYNSIRTNLTLN